MRIAGSGGVAAAGAAAAGAADAAGEGVHAAVHAVLHEEGRHAGGRPTLAVRRGTLQGEDDHDAQGSQEVKEVVQITLLSHNYSGLIPFKVTGKGSENANDKSVDEKYLIATSEQGSYDHY